MISGPADNSVARRRRDLVHSAGIGGIAPRLNPGQGRARTHGVMAWCHTAPITALTMPLTCLPAPTPFRAPTPSAAAAWVRALIWLLVLGVVAQSSALSAQRVLGRAHHHVAVEQGVDEHEDHRHDHDRDHVDHRDHDHDDHHHHHDHGHRYGNGLSDDHDHPRGDATVVYVQQADHGHAPSHGPSSSRTVVDLDGLMPYPATWPDRGRIDGWSLAEPVPLASHLTTPLERPPRG